MTASSAISSALATSIARNGFMAAPRADRGSIRLAQPAGARELRLHQSRSGRRPSNNRSRGLQQPPASALRRPTNRTGTPLGAASHFRMRNRSSMTGRSPAIVPPPCAKAWSADAGRCQTRSKAQFGEPSDRARSETRENAEHDAPDGCPAHCATQPQSPLSTSWLTALPLDAAAPLVFVDLLPQGSNAIALRLGAGPAGRPSYLSATSAAWRERLRGRSPRRYRHHRRRQCRPADHRRRP